MNISYTKLVVIGMSYNYIRSKIWIVTEISIFGNFYSHLRFILYLSLYIRPPYSPRLIVLDNPNVVFLICDTKIRHELASSEYNVRRETCAAAADKMGKPSLRDASIHDLESM